MYIQYNTIQLENVERQRRKDEYHRLKTLSRMQKRAKRTEDLLQKRETLLAQRKAIAIATKKQREVIVRAMEEAKSKKNWKAASQKIAKAMAIDPMANTTRSKGTRRKGGRSRRRMGTAKSLPNLGRRRRRGSSASAQQEFSHSQAALRYEEKAREMTGSVGRSRTADSAAGGGGGGSRPAVYRSPYEEIQYETVPIKSRGGQADRMLGPGGRAETMPAFAHVS